jgi:lipopolysaccharide O-acetyltransferase
VLRIISFIFKNGISNSCREAVTRIIGIFIFRRWDVNVNRYPFVRGRERIEVGKNFRAGKHLHIEIIKEFNGKTYNGTLKVKDNVMMHHFIHIGVANYVEMGNNVLMASYIYISDHNHGFYKRNQQSNPMTAPIRRILTYDKPVVIGDNAWIGEMVTILPGVSIGEGSIIGGGAVVTKSIPPYSIAVGNPAKVVKQFDFKKEQWVRVKGKSSK